MTCPRRNEINWFTGPGNVLQDPLLVEIGKRKGCSAAQVLLAWNVHRGVVPVPKCDSVEMGVENLKALEVELSEEEMMQIAGLDKNNKTYPYWVDPVKLPEKEPYYIPFFI